MFTLLAAGCGGGGTGGAVGAGDTGATGDASELEKFLPDTSLPEGPPNAALFGTWTFKTAVAIHNCDPGMVNPSVSEQEIRIIKLPFACELSGYDENGNSLEAASNSTLIFDARNTNCGAGGDILVLGDGEGGELFPGCSVNFNMVARLTLSGNKLVGPLVGTVDFEGAQCEWSDCHASTQLEGTRGANIQGGFAYMSPPPNPAPVNPAPQGGGGGGGVVPQPAPQPAPAPAPQPQPGGATRGRDPRETMEEDLGNLVLDDGLPGEDAEGQSHVDIIDVDRDVIDIDKEVPRRDHLPKFWDFNGF